MKNRSVSQGSKRHLIWRVGAVLSVASLSFAGLVGTGTASSAAKKPTITVWVDSTRIPAVKDYQKTHPGVNVKMVVYAGGGTALTSKISLFNRIGKGWPDVVWSNAYADIATLADPTFHFPAKLDTGLV